jgi:hypothetical protein
VLAGYYAAAMEVDDELEVVVLPPFALHNYDPRTDLRDIAVLLTLAPGTQHVLLPTRCVRVPPTCWPDASPMPKSRSRPRWR